MKTRPTFNTKKHSLAALAATLLVMAACSSDAEAEADADDEPAAVQDAGDSQDDGDSDNSEVEPVDDSDNESADDSADTGPASVAMTGEDGWTELHDLPIPDPGTASVTINGETYTVEDVTCLHAGVVDDEAGAHQFIIHIGGTFTANDGRSATFLLNRTVTRDPEAFEFYDYQGLDQSQVTISVETDEGHTHNAAAVSPSEEDPTGSALPMVHAQPDGSFTVQHTLEKLHPTALDGDVAIAGQCPDPWPDNS